MEKVVYEYFYPQMKLDMEGKETGKMEKCFY